MALQIVFIIVSLFVLGSAWVVVTNRNLFHAALAMMATFLGVAAMYVLLDAGILAVAQLLVYIGAISILVIFAIMMTRRLMQTTESAFNAQWQGALVASVVLFGIILVVYLSLFANEGFRQATAGAPDVGGNVLQSSVTQLGVALVSPDLYVIPFELASILLLAALIGSILIARPEKEEE
ncbi:MAG: NADH-quinone oxidoreductase subunit J [Ardenticatenaceae bacterium]|nr:NADH-quinone oxidoreductase subunit J [Anaerolineales bacterium]MCB8919624.1 NADH-quinone oxidoreductase subunit J [Ardenticatenaceae bacterium]